MASATTTVESGPKRRNKRFVPLENNPDVMTSLVHRLGLSESITFHDVFSIDDPDLLAFVPRPAYALLLVFPCTDTYEKYKSEEDADIEEYQGSGSQEQVLWYRQTVGNACGLMGLLHGVSNHPARDHIKPNSDLAQFIEAAIPLQPTARADLIFDSQALENAHQAAAATGDTSAPAAEDRVDLHYVCFVKSENNHLWELDGDRKGPLDRGEIGSDDDVLSEKALDAGVRRFLKREAEAGGGELRFSLLVLAPSLD